MSRRLFNRFSSILTFAVFMFLTLGASVTAQELLWAKRAGGTAADQGLGLAVDGLGNSYVTGLFTGSATFGLGEIHETTLISVGLEDVFVAKYNSDGELIWARRAGGPASDHGVGIAVDGLGNSYVTGFFHGVATFASGEVNETSLTSAGDRDGFIAKYDSDGALLWVKRVGGTGSDRGYAIAVDGFGESYLTGSFGDSGFFGGSAIFGEGEPNATTLTSPGLSDIFLAKYNFSGALLWAKRAGGTSADGAMGIGVDGSGNSYITGFFNGINHHGTATFGLGEANQTTLTSAGDRDVFVAKYDSIGALVWAKRAGSGGTDTDQALGIAVDEAGSSYVTGFMKGSAIFGSGETNQTTLVSAGGADSFLAKYNSSGNLLWAKRAGGTDVGEAGVGVAVDGSGNSYLAGIFQGSATFGQGEANQTTLVSAGSDDAFIAKHDPSGALLWVKRAGGSGLDRGAGVKVDGLGNVYVTGLFQGSAMFGQGEVTETTHISSGSEDIFIAKFGLTGGTASPPTVTIAATDNSATEEGPTSGMFTISRIGSTASALTVNYQVGGSAISGSDFIALPNSVVVLTGQSSAQIVVTPVDDLAVEADETIIVTLADNLAYTVGAPRSVTVILSDNDIPDQTLPGNIADLKASTVTQTSVTLNWTAPGDEGNTGNATSYDLRYSTTALNQSTFVSAAQVVEAPTPLTAGTAQAFSVPGLLCGRTYYFAIKAVDEANNISAISNIAKGKTAACNKLVVTPKTLPVGEVSVAYNESVSITGGVAPYGVQIDPTKLPPGVSYTSSFNGTPTLAKTFFIPAVVTDAVGSARKLTVKLKIAKPVTITTTSLKAGKAGLNYTATLRAKNGVKPYTWSAPLLPVGLMLDTATGKITGVVSAATGPVDVNFQATDALGATATQVLTLTFN